MQVIQQIIKNLDVDVKPELAKDLMYLRQADTIEPVNVGVSEGNYLDFAFREACDSL